jgi:hypothetical protein
MTARSDDLFRDDTMDFCYVTRVRVRVFDTIRIGYTDTHFIKRNPIKTVYPSIRRVSDTDSHPSWSIHVT